MKNKESETGATKIKNSPQQENKTIEMPSSSNQTPNMVQQTDDSSEKLQSLLDDIAAATHESVIDFTEQLRLQRLRENQEYILSENLEDEDEAQLRDIELQYEMFEAFNKKNAKRPADGENPEATKKKRERRDRSTEDNNLFDDILPPESEADDNMSLNSDPMNLPDPEEDMVDAVEYAKVKKNFLCKLIVHSVKLLVKVDKQKQKMKKSNEINLFDVAKQLLGNLRESEENKTEKLQCLLANEKSMQSYFWSARKSKNMDTKQIIEAEFPGCR